jgi:hypothetical protein
MRHIKFPEEFLKESVNTSEDYWYKILDQSHQDYVDDEVEYNDGEDWDEDDKYWVFDPPVHEYLKTKGMLSIVPSIVEFGESLGLPSSNVEIAHYMMNDFSISWKDHNYPSFSISMEGNEGPSQAMIIRGGEERPNSNLTGPSVLIECFISENESLNWRLFNKNEIPDVMMDLYKDRDKIGKR